MGSLERLLEFSSDSNLSVAQIEQRASLANGLISKARSRGSELSKDTIEKVLKAFPIINREWFVSGDGDKYSKTGVYMKNSNYQWLSTYNDSDFVSILKEQLNDKQRIIDSLLSQLEASTKLSLELQKQLQINRK